MNDKLDLFYLAGALELWELAEDERLLVNRFTKHEHDNIVTTVSPITGASSAVTGSMDCRLDAVLNSYKQLHEDSLLNIGNADCFTYILHTLLIRVDLFPFFFTELKYGISVRRQLSLPTMVR